MIIYKNIYQLIFYLITILIFVVGGWLQFFLGIPNTILTVFIVITMYLTYLIYALLKNRIVVNRIALISLMYLAIIVYSGFYNSSNIASILIYFIFSLLPFGVFLFAYINYKENYINSKQIFSFFLSIALIQLPIIISQYFFYDFLIKFNNSHQQIASFDFLFGSFFLKSDHSLGFFLILILLKIILNIDNIKAEIKFPKTIITYISITILLAQSNISKLFLILLLASTAVIFLYKRYQNTTYFKLGLVIFLVTIFVVSLSVKNSEFVNQKMGGTIEKQFSLKKSYTDYNKNNAKRMQILIVVFSKLKTKWIGDGPYSYFNILTGKFKKTNHFSQIIWSYFDLGIVGLIIIFSLMYNLVRYMNIERGLPFIIFFGIFLIYSLYTTTFSDIAIITSMLMMFNKKKTNEHSCNTIS